MNAAKRKLSPALMAVIGVALTLVIAAVGWFLLVSPQRSRSAELDEQIDALQSQISLARNAAFESGSVEPIRTADLFRLTKAMPSDLDISGVLLELSQLARGTGIRFESIAPGATTTVGSFRVQPTELVFEGQFYMLSDFLYRLRTLVTVQRGRLYATGRLFSVDKVNFTEGQEGFPSIRAVLTVSAYLYGAGTTAGAPPAAPATTTASTETTSTDTTATTTTSDPATTPPDDASAVGTP